MDRKKSLSRNITNTKIDKFYDLARKYGALGGKLLEQEEEVFLFYMKKKIRVDF